MSESAGESVTRLLHEWREGDTSALERLIPHVYDHLHRLASRSFSREANALTLQPTALVNELFLRMLKSDISLQDRAHFFAVCAKVMRAILIDHARTRQRLKRGGEFVRVTLSFEPASTEPDIGIFELNDALERLKEIDPRMVEIVEMHYFGGLTHEEIAETVQISPSTVFRDLRMAKAWLKKDLSRPAGS
ncbi:MAG: sigma-70 family RNA polymerase sigma factor [Bryobacterales bacterium]|nr:sigma-70 family RNA polymerase sigma factor [Bryobacterales bacterium]